MPEADVITPELTEEEIQAARAERLSELQHKAEDRLFDLATTKENWARYLDVMAAHPEIKPLSLALVASSEHAKARELRTFKQWQDLGGKINRGSKALEVLGTNKNGELINISLFSEEQVGPYLGDPEMAQKFSERYKNLEPKQASIYTLTAVNELEEKLNAIDPMARRVIIKKYNFGDASAIEPVLPTFRGLDELKEQVEKLHSEVNEMIKEIDAQAKKMRELNEDIKQPAREYSQFQVYIKGELKPIGKDDNFGNHQYRIPLPKDISVEGVDLSKGAIFVPEYRLDPFGQDPEHKELHTIRLPKANEQTGEPFKVKVSWGHEDNGAWVTDREVMVASDDLAEAIQARRNQVREMRQEQPSSEIEAPKPEMPIQAEETAQPPIAQNTAQTIAASMEVVREAGTTFEELAQKATAEATIEAERQKLEQAKKAEGPSLGK